MSGFSCNQCWSGLFSGQCSAPTMNWLNVLYISAVVSWAETHFSGLLRSFPKPGGWLLLLLKECSRKKSGRLNYWVVNSYLSLAKPWKADPEGKAGKNIQYIFGRPLDINLNLSECYWDWTQGGQPLNSQGGPSIFPAPPSEGHCYMWMLMQDFLA